jgi:hypothetical protein
MRVWLHLGPKVVSTFDIWLDDHKTMNTLPSQETKLTPSSESMGGSLFSVRPNNLAGQVHDVALGVDHATVLKGDQPVNDRLLFVTIFGVDFCPTRMSWIEVGNTHFIQGVHQSFAPLGRIVSK